MNRLGKIGEIAFECQRVEWQIEVDWQINDFLSQPGEDLDCYDSPDFGSPYGRFFMRIFPNWMNDATSEWVRLDLCRDDRGPPRTLKVTIGILGPNGWAEIRREVERGFENRDVWHSVDFCLRSQLSDNARLMPDNVLTIKCEIKNVVPDYITSRCDSCSQDASIQTDSEVTEVAAPANGSQTLNEQAAFLDDENNDGEDDEASRNQVKKTKKVSLPVRHGSVIRSLKAIMTERRRSDFTLKLGRREWPVHRVILEGRCKYFEPMIREEWAENTRRVGRKYGEVPFDDIKEDALDSVLQFIYTGEVEDMSVENVCGLYVAAQKFRSQDLTSMCVEYMKKNMCVEMVCDALAIAKTNDEEDLNESAKEYFFREINIIFDTRGWKQLRQNHPSIISELLKETIKRIKDNRGE